MTPFPWTDLLLLAGLIMLNGVFALSELAIVSARTARLRAAADKGSSGARVALELAADPGKFLSTVQIGITLIGVVAGAFSGASLGGPLGERLAALGVPAEHAPEVGFAAAIALTTYLSLVIGELVPKQVALQIAEPVAMVMARPLAIMARITKPLVSLLDVSSRLIIGLLGVKPSDSNAVTAEELHLLFAEATRSGVIEREQHQMLAGVVRLAQRPVREMMTPRNQLDWIDAGASEAEIRETIDGSSHSLLPVGEGSSDRIVGVVKVREVYAELAAGRTPVLARLLRKAEVVPDQLDAVDALRVLQQADVPIAMVHDEYGHLDGIVTPVDLLTALVGNFTSDQEHGETPDLFEREDGALVVSGGLAADTLADRIGIDYPPDREFATVAGFALSVLKKLPAEGESFEYDGWTFAILEMNGRRIGKVLAVEPGEPLPPA